MVPGCSRIPVLSVHLPQTVYGVYDMAGNVKEWVWDGFSMTYYSESPLIDPRGPSSRIGAIIRSGSWYYAANECRVANRGRNDLTWAMVDMGFRCARSAP